MDPRDVLPIVKPMTLTVTSKVTGMGGAAAVAETETKMETKTVKVNAAGQTTAVTGVTAEECLEDKSTVVGASVGAVLGAGLIASLIALGLVLKRQKGLAMGVGPDGRRAAYYPAGMDIAEMDSRYVVELDSRAKHELEGNRG
ncbi:hypothetical protein V493_02048 [Pseudogymnoascus sp. VKM F-4281 (FW-2241)]|nr:hypothetical protein V493_02048 [Pseudogymnoascus sp. VKM F-4281 (FW-2241)]